MYQVPLSKRSMLLMGTHASRLRCGCQLHCVLVTNNAGPTATSKYMYGLGCIPCRHLGLSSLSQPHCARHKYVYRLACASMLSRAVLCCLVLQRVASQELHISEEELEERLQQVFNLLPGKRQCSQQPAGAAVHALKSSSAAGCKPDSPHRLSAAGEGSLQYSVACAAGTSTTGQSARCMGSWLSGAWQEPQPPQQQHIYTASLHSHVSADLADRLVKAPPKRVVELASSTDIIAARLLRLREIFPKVHQTCCHVTTETRMSLALGVSLAAAGFCGMSSHLQCVVPCMEFTPVGSTTSSSCIVWC